MTSSIFLRIFRGLLIFTGFYPPSLLSRLWLQRSGKCLALFLTIITVLLVVQDMDNLRRITAAVGKKPGGTEGGGGRKEVGEAGGGGPVIPFTMQLYHSIIHFAVLFLRLHCPGNLRPLKDNVDRLWTLGLWTKVKCGARVWVFLGACILQLVYTTYTSIQMPTPFDWDNRKFYTLENWRFIIIKIVDVVWQEMPIMDIVSFGALVFMTWITDLVQCVSRGVERHKMSLRKGGVEPLLSEIFPGGGLLQRELDLCLKIWTIWDQALSLLGLILLHCLWGWSALFCLVTFNLISSAVDLGPLNGIPLGFLFLFVCLAMKLVVITDAAHNLHKSVASLERLLVEVRFEWERSNNNGGEIELAVVQLHALSAHRPLTVTARGHFGVGRETLTAVWGVVSTYVVVLLQFWQTTRNIP